MHLTGLLGFASGFSCVGGTCSRILQYNVVTDTDKRASWGFQLYRSQQVEVSYS
jgi:hypothetical protein